MLEDVNDEIPLFTEREQETVLEGENIGTKVTQVNAIDKDGTFPNNQVSKFGRYASWLVLIRICFHVLCHFSRMDFEIVKDLCKNVKTCCKYEIAFLSSVLNERVEVEVIVAYLSIRVWNLFGLI